MNLSLHLNSANVCDWFKQELQFLANWLNMPYTDPSSIHEEFLKRQLYVNTKQVCDDLLKRILNTQTPEELTELLNSTGI